MFLSLVHGYTDFRERIISPNIMHSSKIESVRQLLNNSGSIQLDRFFQRSSRR